jgi:hypothetical protein
MMGAPKNSDSIQIQTAGRRRREGYAEDAKKRQRRKDESRNIQPS